MSAVSLPLTFRAVGVEQLNTPLLPLQRTVTTLTPSQLLIRVSHSSVQPMDQKVRAHNPFHYPFPITLGGDFSGTVVAVGGAAADNEGEEEPITLGSQVFGMSVASGCFAEYAVVERQLTALRGGMPAREAGTYAGAYVTAFDSLELQAQLRGRRGQTVYVAGAGGGVGHFAVQLALMRGLTVIGSASKPEALRLLRRLGVHHVIDYARQDVVGEVMALTGGVGAQVVYDPTYTLASYAQSAACVRRVGCG